MKKILRILTIEDSEDDALLMMQKIKKGDYETNFVRVETEDEMKHALKDKKWDLILSDFKLPRFNGVEALRILKDSGIDIPFIIVSGTIGEDVAVECMKAGANDYIMKNNMKRLVPAIERELRDAKIRVKHREAEEALAISEERYRTLIENQGEGVGIVNLKEEFTFVNPAGEKIFGVSSGGLNNKCLIEFVSSEQFKKIQSQTLRRSRGEKSTYELEILRPDKEKRTLLITGTPKYDKSGNFIGTFGVFIDITERKQMELAISESEKRFKELANLFPQTIFESNVDGIITFANDAGLKTFGYEAEDISKGLNMINLVSGKDKEAAVDNIKRVLEGLPPVKNEFIMLRKDGASFPALTFTSAIIHDGKPTGLRGTIVDITNQKQIENELRKLSEAVEQSPASIVITDISGNIEYINKTFTDITGYSLEEAINKNPRILKSGKVPIEKYKDLWNTITSGNTWRGELLNKRKNGDLYWEDVHISPLKDKDGKTINFLGVKQDITEKKKMLQELIKAKEEAEEMNRVKTIFFANMSHELRTPFVGIMGFAELLTETLTDPEAKEMAEGILRTSIRMKDTLTKILNLSELEVNETQTFPKKVYIKELISNIYKQYSIAAAKKELSFKTHIDVNKPAIHTDEILLTGILNNLVSNAIIYTNKGGIDLYAENQRQAGRQVLIIKVTDTGIGIPAEKQELVWREFRQASEGTTRSYQGIGLGLSISKKYTELLGGKIYLESKEGRGTTFTLELPEIDIDLNEKVTEQVSANNDEIKREESNQKKKILYVEDDDTSLEVINISLSKHFKVETAKEAEKALSKVKEQKYDAILIDINLGPGMNGIELTQMIRKIPGYESIPIIAVTVYASEEDKNEFLSKGMNSYIAKPFLIQDLVKLVEDVLRSN